MKTADAWLPELQDLMSHIDADPDEFTVRAHLAFIRLVQENALEAAAARCDRLAQTLGLEGSDDEAATAAWAARAIRKMKDFG